MHSSTLVVVVASMAGLVAAIPHSASHQKLHHLWNVRDVQEHRHHRDVVPVRVPVEERDSAATVDSENGTCGGTTGYVCETGYCCSEYGYCGTGTAYCGTTATSATASATTKASTASAASSQTSSSATGSSTTTSSSATSTATYVGTAYTLYTGDGDADEGWPTKAEWLKFDALWKLNKADLEISCAQFDVADNSATEIKELRAAIKSVAAAAGVDPRFVLAVVLQESSGCVRVPSTFGSVTNPGLMQSHDGNGTCNSDGTVQDPCPDAEIVQMIEDGTEGTATGDGLKQCIAAAPAADVAGAAKYYQAARIYNSGSIAADGNLGEGDGTACYSSDIANRLLGWVDAPSTCDL